MQKCVSETYNGFEMTYKALITDVDGTLKSMRRGASISQRVINAIQKAQDNGITISIATARPFEQALPIWQEIQTNGPSVISSGAQVIDFATRKVLREQILNKEDLPKIIKILEDEGVIFYVNDEPQGEEITYTQSYEPAKLIDMYTESMDEEKADHVVGKLMQIPTVAASKVPGFELGENKHHILVNHALATKQHGVLEVAQILGIKTKDIIGIGDGHNDFPLLMACGLKVAIGNAVDDLKAIADYIAPSVDDDGVAHVIEKFLFSKTPHV